MALRIDRQDEDGRWYFDRTIQPGQRPFLLIGVDPTGATFFFFIGCSLDDTAVVYQSTVSSDTELDPLNVVSTKRFPNTGPCLEMQARDSGHKSEHLWRLVHM